MIQLRVKTKLSAGLAFLFIVIIAIGGMSIAYINEITKDFKGVLKDNYESIQYSKSMIESTDKFNDTIAPFKDFERNLLLQEKNLTEVTEKELTLELRNEFDLLKQNKAFASSSIKLRQTLFRIMDVNMQAIVRKNTQVQESGDTALKYIGLICGLCFLIVFTFIINFPGYIADPIKTLTESIKEIANKNYSQRLHFTSRDEFGELAEAFNSMAQKLDDYESSNLAKIIFEKKRIETIINNMRDAIIGLSEKKIILFANLQATKLLGLTAEEINGKYAPDVALTNDLMRAIIKPDSASETIKIFADNKESYFNKEQVAITSEGKAIGEVVLLKNVTRFQELDLAKTNFIATISHELKTPISSIKMSLKLLDDNRIGAVNEEQKDLIKSIKEESDRLLKITGELLNMAQVETGNIQLTLQSTDVREMITYAIEANKNQAKQSKITIDVDIEDNLPTVNADSEKTAWVIINLISNALRYSAEDSHINVSAKIVENQVIVSVQDFGKGIDSKYRDRIFERYFRVPGTLTQGTGLGLAISKEFIEAQGGKIWLTSKIDFGSTFSFVLNT